MSNPVYESLNVGDTYYVNDVDWTITEKFPGSDTQNAETGYFYLTRETPITIHHTINKTYWEVYRYEFMNWIFEREERRDA